MAVDSKDQTENAVMGIWSPESVISGVRLCLDAYREAAQNLIKTNLASIFRVGELWNSVFQLGYDIF